MPEAQEVKTVPVDEETAGAIKARRGRCRQRDAGRRDARRRLITAAPRGASDVRSNEPGSNADPGSTPSRASPEPADPGSSFLPTGTFGPVRPRWTLC